MPQWAKIFAGLSIAALAACTNNPARNGNMGNWQDPKVELVLIKLSVIVP